MIKTGIKGKCSVLVTEKNTAEAVGSGGLPVFATPELIALAEKTAFESLLPYLEAGEGSVGTLVDIRHLAPTPIGMTVECESELVEVDGRRLVFTVTVRDEKETVGTGKHERFIIKNDKFLAKAAAKKAQ